MFGHALILLLWDRAAREHHDPDAHLLSSDATGPRGRPLMTVITQFIPGPIIVGGPAIAGLDAGQAAVIGGQVTAYLGATIATGSIQWRLNGADIPGATTATLTVPLNDGALLSVEVDSRLSADVPVRHPIPAAIAALQNQSLTRNSGTQTYATASAFDFAGTALFTLSPALSHVTIDASGVISFATDSLAVQANTGLTVRCADGGDPTRFAETGLSFSVAATVPAAFAPAAWLLGDAGTGGDATVTLLSLPDTGGSVITDVEFRRDGGTWSVLPAYAGTGVYTLSDLFTDGVASTVELRAVNAEGAGAPSDTKSVTTTGPAPGTWSVSDNGDGTVALLSKPATLPAPAIVDNGDGTVTLS